MKPIIYSLTIGILFGAAYPATAEKLCPPGAGGKCVTESMDGTAEFTFEQLEQKLKETEQIKAETKRNIAQKIDDDVIIKPLDASAVTGSVTNSAEAARPRIDVKLRNGKSTTSTNAASLKSAKERAAALNKKAKIIPAPVIPAPKQKPKPQLTRKQILQNEIRNEQAALARAKAQLNVARKKGDQDKISRLSGAVRDREANIRAIKNEMNR
ncbi:hypothetical protein [Neisseria animalis]|uniref:hypothetical protein n=1 Tax=Neisseria animalis TaxID=492 RepID=UPI000F6E0D7C|nr:hypothetical protein [Neisseria animalis]VEE05965.1 Uncharacterised protein [Neisseria animalis]